MSLYSTSPSKMSPLQKATLNPKPHRYNFIIVIDDYIDHFRSLSRLL